MARQRAEQYVMPKKKKKGKNFRKPRSGGRSSSDQSYDSQQDRNRRQRHVTKDGRRPSIERQLIAAVEKLRREEEMKTVAAAEAAAEMEFRPHRGSSLSDVLSDEFLGVVVEEKEQEEVAEPELEAQTSEGHIADDEDDDERISASWARAHRKVSKDKITTTSTTTTVSEKEEKEKGDEEEEMSSKQKSDDGRWGTSSSSSCVQSYYTFTHTHYKIQQVHPYVWNRVSIFLLCV
jgi:hypothetical protein